MPSNVVLRLKTVSVKYRVPEESISSLKEYAIRRFRSSIQYHDYWALREVSLEVCRGKVLGIIGSNGAGKSTLLKVIARVLDPKDGELWIKGKVFPLLELGAGFHPELTGLENIFLNGTLLGFTHSEIESKIQEIQDFAEIGSFIHSPLRTYSSGMVARLGFSIATAWEPEILLLDEILAVGDAAFQHKCESRIEYIRGSGATIILVTHNIQVVESLCTEALWLEQGQVRSSGIVQDVINAYLNKNE